VACISNSRTQRSARSTCGYTFLFRTCKGRNRHPAPNGTQPADTIFPVVRPTVRRSPGKRFRAPVGKRSSDTDRRQRPRTATEVTSAATQTNGPSRLSACRRDGEDNVNGKHADRNIITLFASRQ